MSERWQRAQQNGRRSFPANLWWWIEQDAPMPCVSLAVCISAIKWKIVYVKYFPLHHKPNAEGWRRWHENVAFFRAKYVYKRQPPLSASSTQAPAGVRGKWGQHTSVRPLSGPNPIRYKWKKYVRHVSGGREKVRLFVVFARSLARYYG